VDKIVENPARFLAAQVSKLNEIFRRSALITFSAKRDWKKNFSNTKKGCLKRQPLMLMNLKK